MTLVVDANVAVKWFVQQEDAQHARRVQSYDGPLIAPAMLISEVTSGIWKHLRAREIAEDQATLAVEQLPRWFSELAADHLMASRALALGIELDVPPYDCFYLALSIEREAPFITADQRFVNKTRRTRYAAKVVPLRAWKIQE